MTRSAFLQHLLALGIIPFLTGKGFQTRHFQKYYLLQSFVRGFQYYNGPSLVTQMKEGDLLELVREPENEHDSCAIALHWNRKKLGFVPAEDNEMLSKLLDIGVPELVAEITHLQPEAAAWENVRIAVYVLKEIKDSKSLPPAAAYLTQLETPRYRTFKRLDNTLTRVEIDEEDEHIEMDIDEAKELLTDLSKHGTAHELYGGDRRSGDDGFVVVDKEKVKKFPLLEKELEALSNEVQKTDAMFDDEGYITVSTNKIGELVDRVVDIGEMTDKLGNKFMELRF